jgi:hypothetical protein
MYETGQNRALHRGRTGNPTKTGPLVEESHKNRTIERKEMQKCEDRTNRKYEAEKSMLVGEKKFTGALWPSKDIKSNIHVLKLHNS